jgi:hypothetical protein
LTSFLLAGKKTGKPTELGQQSPRYEENPSNIFGMWYFPVYLHDSESRG